MPEPFVITRAVHGEIVVLALAGFLDAHTAPRFETAVQSEIDAGHHRLVVAGHRSPCRRGCRRRASCGAADSGGQTARETPCRPAPDL